MIKYNVVGFFNNLVVSTSSLENAKCIAKSVSREYDCQVQDLFTKEILANYSCGRELSSTIENEVKL